LVIPEGDSSEQDNQYWLRSAIPEGDSSEQDNQIWLFMQWVQASLALKFLRTSFLLIFPSLPTWIFIPQKEKNNLGTNYIIYIM
jgi:hypothetical protein